MANVRTLADITPEERRQVYKILVDRGWKPVEGSEDILWVSHGNPPSVDRLVLNPALWKHDRPLYSYRDPETGKYYHRVLGPTTVDEYGNLIIEDAVERAASSVPYRRTARDMSEEERRAVLDKLSREGWDTGVSSARRSGPEGIREYVQLRPSPNPGDPYRVLDRDEAGTPFIWYRPEVVVEGGIDPSVRRSALIRALTGRLTGGRWESLPPPWKRHVVDEGNVDMFTSDWYAPRLFGLELDRYENDRGFQDAVVKAINHYINTIRYLNPPGTTDILETFIHPRTVKRILERYPPPVRGVMVDIEE